ncbi:hypothetical protein Agub_g5256 [Astrephomene gubernaculifera]|uniref:Golgin subfamily A member 7/ERF4 domain-containing protein n=1 Tax=Astrephomene gubernaculifera TaxID=47775 RepID=A0AAD3DLL3_9CHLO|nr:hypothetical protein Agub_g5256 [Astrephomene gubernaculifera]
MAIGAGAGGTASPPIGAPRILGFNPDGRIVYNLPLLMRYDGIGTPCFHENYSLSLEGRLPREVYNDILEQLNAALAYHHDLFATSVGSYLYLSLTVLTLGLFAPYLLYKRHKRELALEAAVRSINARYAASGINLRHNVAAARKHSAAIAAARAAEEAHGGAPWTWQVDLEVACSV